MKQKLTIAAIGILAALSILYGAGTTVNGTRVINGDLTVKGTCTGCSTSPGMVLLQTQTVSGAASVDFKSTDSPKCVQSSYDEYMIEAINAVPATISRQLVLRVSTDGTTFISTASYGWVDLRSGAAGGAASGGANSGATFIGIAGAPVNMGNNANYGWTGSFLLHSVGGSGVFPGVSAGAGHYTDDGGNLLVNTFGGWYLSTTAILGFQILTGTASNISGTFNCYGLRKTV